MPSNHTDLKKFAQTARRSLREQVAARLDQVLRTDSAALREREAVKRELSQQIAETSKKAVIDRVAYTWFNRFCALRFMDVNRYNRIGVVSPAEGFTQPEILQEAKGGYIDEDLQQFVDCPAVFDLLAGRRPSADPQQEAYRLLLVGMCNALNRAMPFLFEPIADYTELLMPQDLLSEHSILHDLREALTPEACQDVEVIGWLYQFYISERKDEVFEALKQNQKIAPEDIPAATQLFTPHWIVRYLVENSLGRLWMLNRPNSRLVEKMDYYIQPEEEADKHLPQETDFLRVASPEEIKVCDPACGSGHMLTYAFDLLTAIYEEEGYPASDIPRLILEKNLYGIEIDERAGDLAAFALAMKARGRDRRFFTRGLQPNICVLENITFTDQELKEYAAAMGRDLFTKPLLQTLKQFDQAEVFGSLIRPVLSNPTFVQTELERKGLSNSIFLYEIHQRAIKIINRAKFLEPCYHVVIANPPYMGNGGMNESLKKFVKEFYPAGSSDLYGCFLERTLELTKPYGYIGMITIPNWMFLESFQELRKEIYQRTSISSLIHNGRGVWGSDFGSCSFVIKRERNEKMTGMFKRLFVKQGEVNSNEEIIVHFFDNDNFPFYRASVSDFKKIPGMPVAYWLSEKAISNCEKYPTVGQFDEAKSGMSSCNSELFLREWYEVAYNNIERNSTSHDEANKSSRKWFPYNKGGGKRRWYGFNDTIINWYKNGTEIKEFVTHNPKDPKTTHWSRRLFNLEYFFQPGITWPAVTSGEFSMRVVPKGIIPGTGSKTIFNTNLDRLNQLLLLYNSKVSNYYLKVFSPTLNYEAGDVCKLPSIDFVIDDLNTKVNQLINISKSDWDSFETSWDFRDHPLFTDINRNSIRLAFNNLCNNWYEKITEMQKLEETNNRICIGAYGLEGEIDYEVFVKDITLTCNPHYRYGGNRSEAELEALLLADTMREFISYAVGCMFGRYSLDKPGLILANQGETVQDYLRQIPDPTFLPDEDNAIPVLDGEWFSDDITERFKKFLRVTFGAEHYEENLAFIEQAVGRDIRSYFLKEFYSQHVKMYQKRPIYWMFSSAKGSFNVLIYMHRYQPDTLSVILNRYLREFRGKLEARKGYLEQVSISVSSTQREKTVALKEIEGLNKTLEEIRVYERDVLYPLAVQGIQIDLDDGVKVNYNKFGKALAKITGLSE